MLRLPRASGIVLVAATMVVVCASASKSTAGHVAPWARHLAECTCADESAGLCLRNVTTACLEANPERGSSSDPWWVGWVIAYSVLWGCIACVAFFWRSMVDEYNIALLWLWLCCGPLFPLAVGFAVVFTPCWLLLAFSKEGGKDNDSVWISYCCGCTFFIAMWCVYGIHIAPEVYRVHHFDDAYCKFNSSAVVPYRACKLTFQCRESFAEASCTSQQELDKSLDRYDVVNAPKLLNGNCFLLH